MVRIHVGQPLFSFHPLRFSRGFANRTQLVSIGEEVCFANGGAISFERHSGLTIRQVRYCWA